MNFIKRIYKTGQVFRSALMASISKSSNDREFTLCKTCRGMAPCTCTSTWKTFTKPELEQEDGKDCGTCLHWQRGRRCGHPVCFETKWALMSPMSDSSWEGSPVAIRRVRDERELNSDGDCVYYMRR